MPISTNTNSYNRNDKRFSDACERNKEPILQILRPVLATAKTVLEIGSGSGQHAVYFGAHLPHITWYTGDLPVNHPSIRAWIGESQLENVRQPIALNVDDAPWSLSHMGLDAERVDAIYTSNTLHIMSWAQVGQLFSGLGKYLNEAGYLCIYGPFKYGGNYNSEGDAHFDAHLKSQGSGSGIRDFEGVNELAEKEGLILVDDILMPANNHLLLWQK